MLRQKLTYLPVEPRRDEELPLRVELCRVDLPRVASQEHDGGLEVGRARGALKQREHHWCLCSAPKKTEKKTHGLRDLPLLGVVRGHQLRPWPLGHRHQGGRVPLAGRHALGRSLALLWHAVAFLGAPGSSGWRTGRSGSGSGVFLPKRPTLKSKQTRGSVR